MRVIRTSDCVQCGNCERICHKDECDHCGDCVPLCPVGARQVEYSDEEQELIDGLGWRKVDGEYKTNAYDPGPEEIRVMNEVLSVYREMDDDLWLVFEEYLEEEGILLSKKQKEPLLKAIEAEAHGYSVLDNVIRDPSLEEVTITRGRVRVYRRGKGWVDADIEFHDNAKVVALINRMARPLGRRVTLKQPRINALLPNGSRMHAAIPPVVESACVTIRKFTETPFTLEDLVAGGLVDKKGAEVLVEAVAEDNNIMVAGSTGSGKTTTLNALCALIPLDQRLVMVEETPEIVVPHEHCVRLVVNQDLGITMDSLVADTLRMRPDKLVVGEVRDEEEVKALMNTMLAGQGKGSLCTFHALSAREAIARLHALGAREADMNALHCIVIQKRINENGKEKRVITEIAGVSDGKLITKWRRK